MGTADRGKAANSACRKFGSVGESVTFPFVFGCVLGMIGM